MNGALKMKITSGEVDDSSQSNAKEISKETVVLCRWESGTWKFGFRHKSFTRVNWWRLKLEKSAFQTFHGGNLTFIDSFD